MRTLYALAFKDTFYSWNDSIYTLEKQEQITELEKKKKKKDLVLSKRRTNRLIK